MKVDMVREDFINHCNKISTNYKMGGENE
jgi:hypothetical protein